MIVVPSQTHGSLLPYGKGHYSPSFVEYSVILGIISFGVFCYLLFVKVFPILHLKEVTEVSEDQLRVPWEWGRISLALFVVILGFVLQFVSYFYLCAPLGIPKSGVYSNPRVDFAPLLFVLGVMLVFIGAVVYELLPGEKAFPENAAA